ncbi:MAG TPA: NADH-quinone oxidoreductase subunit L [Bryobacteraceae bacterium]|nr:NADH-quinone oxidoreductase subunit L [Bryobacteraceae bacterium]
MLGLVWLIPAIPFASALVLALASRTVSRKFVAITGVGSIALSAILSLAMVPAYLAHATPYTRILWTWISVAGFRPQIAFYLDPLSLVMIVVVTFVAFLIHLYSAESMREDPGYGRFFAYMNLFVASMVTLLLADNLLLLFLGWEGVGLCSYLLIGFWYQDPANGRAAIKAFVVTRVGDTVMLVGLFLIFTELGTLTIQTALHQASIEWPAGSAIAITAAALLLGGAIGKSAQLPLQVWLPDAMAGPTPTSALIHAATMVTAGVYLIARMHVLFELAPPVQFAVAVIGAATLLVAGFSALTQYDIKRILAYSTISQIGYMFLALGVGAWGAAIFHFMTHAFFKALLFLSAGIVIDALHDEHNIFRMGGLHRELPIAYWTFLVGGCSLSGLPLITAGSFSKDFIIWSAGTSQLGGIAWWAVALFGVLLTSFYTFRLIFVVFFGEVRTPVSHRPGLAVTIPVVTLATLSIVGGYDKKPFLAFVGGALPQLPQSSAPAALTETVTSAITAAIFLTGVLLAWLVYLRKPELARAAASNPVGASLRRFWFSDWAMDWIYDRLFVRPFERLAWIIRGDLLDSIYDGLSNLTSLFWRGLSYTESGKLRWYAAGIAAGAVVFVAMAIFL